MAEPGLRLSQLFSFYSSEEEDTKMKVRFEEGVRRGRQLTSWKSEDVRSEVAGIRKRK